MWKLFKAGLALCLGFNAGLPSTHLHAGPAQSETWTTPVVSPAYIAKDYSAPTEKWSGGHRGVDFSVSEGAVVIAPTAGSISFQGLVGGKKVLVLKVAPSLRVTFEPVCNLPGNEMSLGERVSAGAALGVVCGEGYSSHCQPLLCLHVGVIDDRGYLSLRWFLGHLPPSRLTVS